MKFILLLVTSLFVGSAFAQANLVKECQAKKWGSCFEAALASQKAGKNEEAVKLLEVACTNTHEASCHMLGLMWSSDKTDAEKAQKGKAALQKACSMKYKPACEDLQKL